MTWKGKVVGGAVVLDGTPPPEGANVIVQLQESEQSTAPSLSETLRSFVGLADGLPSDMAQNHDHYLYGAPKRE